MQELALNWTVASIIFSVIILGFCFGLVHSLANKPNSSSIFVHILSGFIAIGQGSIGTIACIVIMWYFEKTDAGAVVMLHIGLPMASTALLRYYPEQAKQLFQSLINRFTQGKP
jgi:LytS/YehU family sensor histidine kinase